MSARDIIGFLQRIYPENVLNARLVKHFFTLGNSGKQHAQRSWELVGLDDAKRTALGLALQELLQIIDPIAEQAQLAKLYGSISINNRQVSFKPAPNNVVDSIDGHQVRLKC